MFEIHEFKWHQYVSFHENKLFDSYP